MNKVIRIGIILTSSLLLGCAHHSSAPEANAVNVKEAKPQPVSGNTHFAAGQLAESEGRYDVAISQYQLALRADPKNTQALYRLGISFCYTKQFTGAIDTFNRYLKATNNNPNSYADLGYCYELSGDQASAAQNYQEGINRDSKNVPCRTNYGLMLARQNHEQEAIRMWQPVLSDAEIHYNLASSYEGQGRKTEARAEFQKALDLDPNLIDAKQRLADIPLNQ